MFILWNTAPSDQTEGRGSSLDCKDKWQNKDPGTTASTAFDALEKEKQPGKSQEHVMPGFNTSITLQEVTDSILLPFPVLRFCQPL